MKNLESLTFQVAEIRFAKDGFNIVKTTRGDSVSGNFHAQLGYVYKGEGTWDRTSARALQWGPTFKLESAISIRVTENSALGRLLVLRLKGLKIGEHFIAGLVQACEEEGEELEKLLDSSNRERLLEFTGIRNQHKIDLILEKWPTIKPQVDLISPLLGYGLTELMAEKLITAYGNAAVEKVRSRPYELILEMDGISFLTADNIAKKVGIIAPQNPLRIQAAFATGLHNATVNGDIGVPRAELLKHTSLLVNEVITENGRRKLKPGVLPAVSNELLEQTLDNMLAGKAVLTDGGKCKFSSSLVEGVDSKGVKVIWYKPLLQAEEAIAECISELNAEPRLDLVEQLQDIAEKANMPPLAAAQLSAAQMVFSNPISIITGGPGCGKSFILKLLLETFKKAHIRGDLVAPTGKAAKRITESTGCRATTIHNLLGYSPAGTGFNKHNKLASQFLVMDEASMADVEITAALFNALPRNCRVILVGDVDQLPSVGPGQVLRDLIRSNRIPKTRLTKGWRFSGGIAEAAKLINAGKMPESTADGQVEVIETETPSDELIAKFKELINSGVNPDDIQVLSPTNKGKAGCEALNTAVQSLINPIPPKKHYSNMIKRPAGSIHVGDRVIQTKNDKLSGLVNGDICWIESIDSNSGNVEISLPNDLNRKVLEKNKTDNLRLAYCITIHKSQGAESPYILLSLDPSATFMLRRSLVYTGLTRAKQKVIVFSNRNTLQRAVRIGEPPEGSRRTTLVEALKKYIPEEISETNLNPAPTKENSSLMFADIEDDDSI